MVNARCLCTTTAGSTSNATKPANSNAHAAIRTTDTTTAATTTTPMTRTEFEEQHHLARALSRNKVTPAQQIRWQKQVKKKKWDLKPFEVLFSPPYEHEALSEIHSRSFDANVLLEIRDVRLPASSHHPSFTRLAKHRLHLVCYTHADMIDVPTRDKVEVWTNKSWPGSRSIFVDTRENRSDLPYDMLYDSLVGYLEAKGGMNSALTVGVPNTGKSSVLLALIRLARARGDIPKQLKATVSHRKKRKLAKSAPVGILDKPGKTREITEYLIRETPRAFFLDVPGITPPSFFFEERPEAWFGYGAANLMAMNRHMTEDVQLQTALCDYVLHCLNRDGNFMYIPKLGLEGPTDDIEEVLFKVKEGRNNVVKNAEKLQLQRCASFLKLFNSGNLGPVILDDISKPYRKFEFKDSHFVKAQNSNYGKKGNHDDELNDGQRKGKKGRQDGNDDEFREDDFEF